jgi:hypothetical protein
MSAARDPRAEHGRGRFAFGVLTMLRDPDGSHEAYALDQERGSRMPYYISLALLGFLIVALAARLISAHGL